MSRGDEMAVRRIDQGGEPPAEVRAGAAIYSPLVLALYDAMVVHLANQYAWRCPMPVLLEWYGSHVSRLHVGRCAIPAAVARLLLDGWTAVTWAAPSVADR